MARFVVVFGWCLCCVAARTAGPAAVPVADARTLSKRSAAPESNHDDYPDYLLGVKYDEYPMIVPKKRAALLIDRLMVALQKAIEDEEGRTKNYALRSDDGMDLQRRGHQSVSGQTWSCNGASPFYHFELFGDMIVRDDCAKEISIINRNQFPFWHY